MNNRRLLRILTPSYSGNISKLFLYYALYHAMFFSPTWVIYMQEMRGLSLIQVTAVDMVFWFSSFLFSIPVGVIADAVGRKKSMMGSLISGFISTLIFASGKTVPMLMLGNVFWALGFALSYGAIISIFFDSLKQMGREGEFTRQRGLLSAVLFGSLALSSILGGFLGDIDLRLPFLAYAIMSVFTFLVLLSIKETPFEPDPETGERISYKEALATAFQTVKERPNLRFTLLYSNFIPIAAILVGSLFIQAHARSIGFPIVALGFISFGLHIVRMLGSYNADKVVKTFGEWGWLRIAPITVIISMLGLSLIKSWPGIVVFGLAGFGTTATRPLIETIMMRNAPGAVRATILSFDIMLFNLFIVMIEPVLGFIGENYSLPTAFGVMAVFSFLTLGSVLFFWRRVWDGD